MAIQVIINTMKKSEIQRDLTQKCLEWYLMKSDGNFFTAPEAFSPLYRVLYEHLLTGKRPPFYLDDVVYKNRQEIALCDTTFDRYLVALFPSRFEAANPFQLKNKDMSPTRLQEYLQENYGKSSVEQDSYKLTRELDKLLELIDPKDAQRLRKKAKSAQYKLLVLSYKLSLINKHWRRLFRYIPHDDLKHASMDNVVDFNQISIEKARLNSALVKMFYFELDQGKKDGDVYNSRRMIQLPYYLDTMGSVLRAQLFQCQDSDSFTAKAKILEENFLAIVAYHEEQRDIYTDCDQELFDLMQSTLLVNINANETLAREHFLSDSKAKLCPLQLSNSDNWLYSKQTNLSLAKYLAIEDNLTLTPEWHKLAKTLSIMALRSERNIAFLKPALLENICYVLIAWLFRSGDANVTGNIQGLQRNAYNACMELKKCHHWLQEHDPTLRDKHNLSIMRPTSLHFFEYSIDTLLWTFHRKNERAPDFDFHHASLIYYQTLHRMITTLTRKNHMVCLNSIEMFCTKETNGYITDLDSRFIRTWQDEGVLEKLQIRKKIYWSPLGNT
ncbi:TPA: hypothetical protein SLP42_001588 [Klebsiella aerogenes]|nr:hypothetical protein [Klebsiella aerogenes]